MYKVTPEDFWEKEMISLSWCKQDTSFVYIYGQKCMTLIIVVYIHCMYIGLFSKVTHSQDSQNCRSTNWCGQQFSTKEK